MAVGYNRIIMVGNLTRDPELKVISAGNNLCRLGLASSRQSKNRTTGALIQEVCFVDIEVWGVQADNCNQYLQKGRPILVEGRLKLDSWTDTEGKNRSKHTIVAERVVFLGGANTNNEAGMGDQTSDLNERIDDIRQRVNSGSSSYKENSFDAQDDSSRSTPPRKKIKINEDSYSNNDISFKDEPPFKDELPF